MTRLARLQRAFQHHIDWPGAPMQAAVAPGPRADASRRLGVYAEAYRLRLVEALGNDYPALRFTLGEAGFARRMREFVEARPSRHANLRWYGAELSRHLARAAARRPLLAELARFEWALGLAFDAADAPPATVADVARIPSAGWPRLRLRLHPSVQRVELFTNAPDVWRAAVRHERRLAARRLLEPRSWLVWRKDLEPFYRALSGDEARALAFAARGWRFGRLCGGLRDIVGTDQAAPRAASLLKAWLNEGLIGAIE